jgi:hypothetical protein
MSRNCYAKFTESGLPFPRTLHRARLDTECSTSTLSNGGRVVVTLTPMGEGWALSVADDGPGIPVEDRNQVFEEVRSSSSFQRPLLIQLQIMAARNPVLSAPNT